MVYTASRVFLSRRQTPVQLSGFASRMFLFRAANTLHLLLVQYNPARCVELRSFDSFCWQYICVVMGNVRKCMACSCIHGIRRGWWRSLMCDTAGTSFMGGCASLSSSLSNGFFPCSSRSSLISL